MHTCSIFLLKMFLLISEFLCHVLHYSTSFTQWCTNKFTLSLIIDFDAMSPAVTIILGFILYYYLLDTSELSIR